MFYHGCMMIFWYKNCALLLYDVIRNQSVYVWQALEDDLTAHEPQLLALTQCGDQLVNDRHMGADRVRVRVDQVVDMWNRLKQLADRRRQQLQQAIGYHQFFTDADDVDTWLLDTLRVVSSDDLGGDESSVQNLLQKHQQTSDAVKQYSSVVDQLHAQAADIGPEYRDSSDVAQRLDSIDNR